MIKKNTFRLRTVLSTLVVLFVVLVASLIGVIKSLDQTATAAGNANLNFQARLKTSSGAIVPDGDYNFEFKIYNAETSSGSSQGSCSGDANCLWTETYTGSDKIRVVNGYMTVSLGSETAFPGNINWGEQLWLSMNIGGTSSPDWDGEMDPRLRLTAVPLAFKANNVGSGNTNSASTNSNDVSITTGNASGSTSNSGGISIDTGTATGTAGAITLGATNASAITLGRSGLNLTIAGTASVQGGTLSVGGASQSGTLTLYDSDSGSETVSLVAGAISSSFSLILPTTIGGANQCLMNSATPGELIFNNCAAGSASSLQDAYDVDADGSDAVITLNATDGKIVLRDASSTIGTLFVIEANGGADYLSVASTGITLGVSTTIAANQSLRITGGDTASRPGSPTEGMVYFDTDTDRLMTYSNGKWQTDNREAILVAASNSSQADKDAADYVANGDGGGAGDGDQVQINSALTAASGKKVVLLAGTYVVDETILIANNTTLAGVGNGTIIQLADLDADENIIENSDTSTGSGIIIRDIKLDGQAASQTGAITQAGIFLNGMGDAGSNREGAHIENVWIDELETIGIYLVNSDLNSIEDNDIENVTFGVYLDSSNNNIINNNFLADSSAEAIFLDGSSNNIVNKNNIRDVYSGVGIYIYAGTSELNEIVSNQINDAETSGIYIEDGTYTLIQSNIIGNSGGATDNNGIILSTGGTNYNQVISNTITDSSCDTTCYAIFITHASAVRNYLEGNRYSDTDADSGDDATIHDLSTSTIYAGQSTGITSGTDVSNFLFRGANSATAFMVQNATGTSVLTVDTSTAGVTIGGTLTVTGLSTLNGGLTVEAGDTFTFNSDAFTDFTGGGLYNNSGVLSIVNTGASGYFQNGGNLFAAGAVLGTNDSNSLILRTNSTTALTIDTSQNTALAGNLTVAASKYIALTGGNTASRPGSPTEGMIYFDSDTDSLLTYANGKWQSDRGEFVVVAASDSSQAEKDSADYVADGTGDQSEINSALTAAAGGKVILLAGTYTVSDSISIPNNTTLSGAGPGTVIQLANLDVDENIIQNTDTSTGTGVVVRDMTLDGRSDLNTAGMQKGIYLLGMGSSASDRTGAHLSNLQFINFRANGVDIDTSELNSVEDSFFTNIDADGIFLSDFTSDNNTIANNTFTSAANGITIYSDNNKIQNNNIKLGSIGIYVSVGSYNTIDGNIVDGAGTGSGASFYIESSQHNIVTNNQSLNSIFIGIRLDVADYNLIEGNMVVDSNGSGSNDGIWLLDSDFNQIVGNTITDSQCDTTCYAIDISDSGSDKNYFEGNRYSDTDATGGDDATINDAGTGTIYAGQSTGITSGTDVSNFLFRGANSATAFMVQNASGSSVFNIDTTNFEVEVGNASAAGELMISDGSSNFVKLTASGVGSDYTLTLPTTSGSANQCLMNSATPGELVFNNCAAGSASSLQDAYDVDADGSDAVITLNSTDGKIVLRDASSTIGTLFVIEANGGADYLSVASTGVTLGVSTTLAANQTLNLTGGNTASRPGSPTEGMVYFDTDTDSLLVYSNGKWQADRVESVIVAASNSSQAVKDSADYVADGTSDETEINAALTEAAGSKVFLAEGTFTIDGSIVIDDNTTLEGSGAGSVITIANGFNTAIEFINGSNNGFSTGNTGIVIRNLTLDGNDANNTGAQNGISIYADFSGTTNLKDLSVTNTLIEDFSGGAIYSEAFYSTFENNTIRNTSIAIDIQAGDNNIVTNNKIHGSSTSAIYLYESRDNIISNNSIVDSSATAIDINASSHSNTVSNNVVANAGGSTDNEGILIDSADFNQILNNTITDTQCDTTCYAINISNSGSDKNYLEGNRYSDTDATGGDDATINDAGTGTIYAGQSTGTTSGTDVSNFLFRGANSATAFMVQNATGTSVLTVNSSTPGVTVGGTLNVSGAATLTSSLSVEGNTTLGNATSDTITFTGYVNSHILPATNDTYDLGSDANRWKDLYLGGETLHIGDSTSDEGAISYNTSTNVLSLQSTGTIGLSSDVVIASGKYLTITGGNTASRPGSPTEGMTYFDTDTDRLLIYSNGKWQTDRSEVILVAASNSSQEDKDAADYVADGTDDQVQINDALADANPAGSGRDTGKVYLFAGTYTTHRTANSNATILVPNNTTLAGAGAGTLIQLGDIDTADNLIENSDTSTGTGVVIRDLQINGQDTANTSGSQHGIYLSGMGNGSGGSARLGGQVINVIVKDFRTAGITLVSSSNNTIQGVMIQGVGTGSTNQAIFISSTSYTTITGNTIQGNAGYGIILSSGTNLTISGNTLTGNGGPGLEVTGTVNTSTVVGNVISGNTGGGIDIFSGSSVTQNVFSNNTISGNTLYGITVDSAQSNTFSGNTIISNSSGGIFLTTAHYNLISDNTIQNNGGTTLNQGIALSSSDFNQIIGNYITDSQCDTACLAISISGAGNDKNYVGDNFIYETDATYDDEAMISDSGTGTIYGNQMTPSEVVQSSSSLIRASASRALTGTANPTASTTLNGTSTSTRFVAELQVGDRITINAETRTVVSITDNDTLVVDLAFTDTADAAITRLPAALRVTNSSGTQTFLINDIGMANFRNSTDSTTAFQVQRAGSGGTLFTIDTSTTSGSRNGIITVGEADANATLLVLDSKDDNTSNDPTGIQGAMYYNSETHKFRCYEGATGSGTWKDCITTGAGGGATKVIKLIPEFAGGTLVADGSNNSGSMLSDYDGTNFHNYYQWSTSQGSAQDYDVLVNVQIPSDYTGGMGTDSNYKFYIYDGDGATTTAQVTWTMTDVDGTQCFTSNFNGGSSNTWEQETATGLGIGSCTFAANDIITFRFRIFATSSAAMRIGEMQFQYTN